MSVAVPSDFYEHRLAPVVFDLVIATLILPFGGIHRLRPSALDRIAPSAGSRVLEPGCGSGGLTRLLLARGAEVTSVERSTRMLKRAKRRAPAATFVQGCLDEVEFDAAFDVVFFAFVLHELTPPVRRRVLGRAVNALAPGGRIVVLDHAGPERDGPAPLWRSLLLRLEPPTVPVCIHEGYAAELEAAGARVDARHPLAGGTAALTVARRA